MAFTLVIVESPFSAYKEDGSWDAVQVKQHIAYARRALSDCLERGESPYASHLLYTQPGVLDDSVPEERKLGVSAGHAWIEAAERTVVYADYGISLGMLEGMRVAAAYGKPVAFRYIGQNDIFDERKNEWDERRVVSRRPTSSQT